MAEPKLPDQHPYERRVKLLQEYIDEKIKMYQEYLRINGRPAFYSKLTPEQELALYMDPAARAKLAQQKLTVDGQDAYLAWVERMNQRLAQLQAQGDANAQQGPRRVL